MKILLIDNYDSFTYNLADYLARAGAELLILRNDAFELNDSRFPNLDGVVLSPGPSTPENAGLLMPFIKQFENQLPMLGVCLGFQALGIHFGAELVKSGVPVHGKSSEIVCQPHAMYESIPQRHRVGRYHSLRLENIPDVLSVISETSDGIPMAFAHRTKPIWAVQYHPEAVLTEYGMPFIRNWMQSVKILADERFWLIFCFTCNYASAGFSFKQTFRFEAF